MKHIIKQGQKFEREDLPREQALARLAVMNEPYKQEYANELFEKKQLESLSFYRNGPFLDMCEGPHVESTRKIRSTRSSCAAWRAPTGAATRAT